MDRVPERESEPDIRSATTEIEALIQREVDRGVPPERIVLAGFSQGAAMALHVGLRHPRPLAGIMCLSGYLVLEDRYAEEAHEANRSTPMFFGHGSQDDVVALASGRRAWEAIHEGREAPFHTYPMGHELCNDELRDLRAWLHTTLR